MHRSRLHPTMAAAMVAVSLVAACTSTDSLPSEAEPPEPSPAGRALDAAAFASNTWTPRASMQTPRTGLVAATVAGVIYTIGGENASGVALPTVEAYLPNGLLFAWITKAPLPAPRARPNGAAVIGGKIYVTGGLDGQGNSNRTLYVYDPMANTWTRKTPMPVASAGGGSAVIEGKLYVLCTPTGLDADHSRLFRYNPGSNAWIELASPPYNHHGAAVGAIGGKLFVAGRAIAKVKLSNEVSVYDPATDRWSAGPPMPNARVRAAARVIDGRLYVAGGYNGMGASVRTHVFDPATNTWSARADILTPRWGAAAAAYDRRLYVFGGESENYFAPFNKNEMFTP